MLEPPPHSAARVRVTRYILPMDTLASALVNKRLPLPIRAGLLDLTIEVWLVTQRPLDQIRYHDKFMRFLAAEFERLSTYVWLCWCGQG